jgi:polysaccharide biosynthesis protein PelA
VRRARFLCIAALAALAAAAQARAEEPVRRLIVALYNGAEEEAGHRSRVHRLAEMPLNHLGFVVRLYDVRNGLPGEAETRDARAILTWFSDNSVRDAVAYVRWLDTETAAGKRLVLIGHPGFDLGLLNALAVRSPFEAVMGRLGLRWHNEFVSLTYKTRVLERDLGMVEFERPYPPALPPYHRTSVVAREARPYLTVGRSGTAENDHLVVTGPGGGYVSWGYEAFILGDPEPVRAWYIDPFRFFREALGADDVPKLDTTTMSGRRMYYSHVDGDAWHNVSSVEPYRGKNVLAAKVLFDRIILKYPDLPVTIGPITADLDASWYGTPRDIDLAKEIFAQPNVEAGTHTHSHPFAWAFFRRDVPRREAPYLARYPARPGMGQAASVWNPATVPETEADRQPVPKDEELPPLYERPRSYAVRPFDIEMEIGGSIRFLEERVLPPGKRVAIVQWSGDTTPFERALRLTREAKIRNINGGDPRMDGESRSYAHVSPLGRRVGDTWQVYSSGANENIYTENWRARFFGFRFLAEALANMETPIRVKPINIYYHFYSVERADGLAGVLYNIEYARGQEIAPVTTSRFAAMVDGFFGARIVRLGERRWRIEDRDGIETVRFDRASTLAVDFAASEGVIGQRHHQGSLYVALDAAVAAPVVALKEHERPERDPEAGQPYLVQSRWRVEKLELDGARRWRFRSEGFGPGEFAWHAPAAGRYVVTARNADVTETTEAATGPDGRLAFALKLDGVFGAEITVEWREAAP